MGLLKGLSSFVDKALDVLSEIGGGLTSVLRSDAASIASSLLAKVGVNVSDPMAMAARFGSWLGGIRDSKGSALVKGMLAGGSTNASEALSNFAALAGITVGDVNTLESAKSMASTASVITSDSGEMKATIEKVVNSGSTVTEQERYAAKQFVDRCYSGLRSASPGASISSGPPGGRYIATSTPRMWNISGSEMYSAMAIGTGSNAIGSASEFNHYVDFTLAPNYANFSFSSDYTWRSVVTITYGGAVAAPGTMSVGTMWNDGEPALESEFSATQIVVNSALITEITATASFVKTGGTATPTRLWFNVFDGTAAFTPVANGFVVAGVQFLGTPKHVVRSVPDAATAGVLEYYTSTSVLSAAASTDIWGDHFGAVDVTDSSQYLDPTFGLVALWNDRSEASWDDFFKLMLELVNYMGIRPSPLSSGANMSAALSSVLNITSLTATQYAELVNLRNALSSSTTYATLSATQVASMFSFFAATMENTLYGLNIDDSLVRCINSISGYAIAES
jgi:hypothetical protein